MSDTLKVSIEKLKQSTAKLNKITDDASEVVLATEAFLNKECSVGLETSVLVSRKVIDAQRDWEEQVLLGYERCQGNFRIIVKFITDPDVSLTKPWAECDRTMKLETVKYLPELLEKTAAAVNERVTAAEKATSIVADVLHALDRKGAK